MIYFFQGKCRKSAVFTFREVSRPRRDGHLRPDRHGRGAGRGEEQGLRARATRVPPAACGGKWARKSRFVNQNDEWMNV